MKATMFDCVLDSSTPKGTKLKVLHNGNRHNHYGSTLKGYGINEGEYVYLRKWDGNSNGDGFMWVSVSVTEEAVLEDNALDSFIADDFEIADE